MQMQQKITAMLSQITVFDGAIGNTASGTGDFSGGAVFRVFARRGGVRISSVSGTSTAQKMIARVV